MSNWVNRYPTPRTKDHSTYREVEIDGETLTVEVVQGEISKMETRGVSFGKNTDSFLYDHSQPIINGMPRYDTVVFHVRTTVWVQGMPMMGDRRAEIWNSTVEKAIEQYGEFAEGDKVEVLYNEAHVPISIAKI